MKMIPHFYVDDMAAALAFYTGTLDFALAPWDSPDDWVLTLVRDDVELMLTRHEGDQVPRANCYLLVDDVDGLFHAWTRRGLDQSDRTESPVHLGPVDQSWGTREFYVTDPAGNTLRIAQRGGRGVNRVKRPWNTAWNTVSLEYLREFAATRDSDSVLDARRSFPPRPKMGWLK